jgi:hypothetical protein
MPDPGSSGADLRADARQPNFFKGTWHADDIAATALTGVPALNGHRLNLAGLGAISLLCMETVQET